LREEFQGDDSVELRILGLVNYAHATFAKFLEYVVVRYGLADHVIEPVLSGRTVFAAKFACLPVVRAKVSTEDPGRGEMPPSI
jgi:hypothetical protein